MRFLTFAVLFGVISVANASLLSSHKRGMDKEGNCVPELISENARLYSEIEGLDQIATRCETQLKSPLKETQKLGFDGLREMSSKAKLTLQAIKRFGETYGETQCKAQIPKKGKMEVIILSVKERVNTLDKLAETYEQIADNFLKTHLANK